MIEVEHKSKTDLDELITNIALMMRAANLNYGDAKRVVIDLDRFVETLRKIAKGEVSINDLKETE